MAIAITLLYLLAAIALNRVGATPLANAPADSEATKPDLSSVDKKVIIQLFQWNWQSVGDECEHFIGPAGYGYVQGASAGLLRPPLRDLSICIYFRL